MKKRKVISISVLVLSFIIIVSLLGSAVIRTPKDPQNADRWLENNPIDITVVGNPPAQQIANVSFKGANFEKLAQNPVKSQALWIAEGQEDKFNSLEGIALMKRVLHKGNVIMFSNPAIKGDIKSIFGINSREVLDKSRSNVKEDAFYVWEDVAGNIHFGIVGSTLNCTEEQVLNHMVEQTVNHLDFQNKNFPLAYDNNILDNRVFADNLTVDYEWGNLWDYEYNWQDDWGDKLNEWKRIWAIHPDHDSNSSYDYFLVRLDDQFVPADGKYTDNFVTQSTGSSDQDLYDYGPTSSPGTGTVGWNIGVSESGISAGASASWDVSDLYVYDSSDYSIEAYDIEFEYKDSTYARGTTRQYPAWILRVPEGNSPGIDNTRKAIFHNSWWSTNNITKSYTTYPGSKDTL